MEINSYFISQDLSQKNMTAAEYNYDSLSTEVSVPPWSYQGSHAEVSRSTSQSPVHTSGTHPSDQEALAPPRYFMSNSVPMDYLPRF